MEHIPILKIGDLMLVTIQVDLHDRLALDLQDRLAEQVARHGARGVLIDLSSLEVVDSFMGRTLFNISSLTRVLGAETVVVGIQPAVAMTMVELGFRLQDVNTALNVEQGMEWLHRRTHQVTG